MRIPQNYIQRTKAGIHGAQAFCIFIAGCLSLAVLTKDGETGGQVGYFFGLCFLSIPALVYQVMVPMWSRAWRFANVYAYAAIDVAFTILWFAAFIAVATWEAAGIRAGSKDKKDDDQDGSCSHFAYGSASKCSVSKASVGFGVIICILFALTSAISVYGIRQYRKTGIMPNGNSKVRGQAQHLATDDGDKDAWNTNTDELDPNHPSHNNPFDDPVDERQAYGQLPQQDEEQGIGLLNNDRHGHRNTSHDEHSIAESGEVHPGRPVSFGGSSTNLSVAPPQYDEALAPSAFSPSDVEQTPGGRVSFPPGKY